MCCTRNTRQFLTISVSDDLANVFLRMKQLRWSDTEGDVVKFTFKKSKKRDNVEKTDGFSNYDFGEEGIIVKYLQCYESMNHSIICYIRHFVIGLF